MMTARADFQGMYEWFYSSASAGEILLVVILSALAVVALVAALEWFAKRGRSW